MPFVLTRSELAQLLKWLMCDDRYSPIHVSANIWSQGSIGHTAKGKLNKKLKAGSVGVRNDVYYRDLGSIPRTFLALLSYQVGKFRNFNNINIISNPNTSSFNNPNIATSRALNVPAQKVKPWMLYFICHTLDPNKSRQHLTLKEKHKW